MSLSGDKQSIAAGSGKKFSVKRQSHRRFRWRYPRRHRRLTLWVLGHHSASHSGPDTTPPGEPFMLLPARSLLLPSLWSRSRSLPPRPSTTNRSPKKSIALTELNRTHPTAKDSRDAVAHRCQACHNTGAQMAASPAGQCPHRWAVRRSMFKPTVRSWPREPIRKPIPTPWYSRPSLKASPPYDSRPWATSRYRTATLVGRPENGNFAISGPCACRRRVLWVRLPRLTEVVLLGCRCRFRAVRNASRRHARWEE